MKYIIIFFATGCYAGKIPLAPGTWGTAVGFVLWWFIRTMPHPAYAATLAVFIIFSVWVAGFARVIFEKDDPPEVVIDEIAGFLVTMAFHDVGFWMGVVGFALFRFFDIVKPWPVRLIDRKMKDGRGIVLDDVMAGVYANAVLWVITWNVNRGL